MSTAGTACAVLMVRSPFSFDPLYGLMARGYERTSKGDVFFPLPRAASLPREATPVRKKKSLYDKNGPRGGGWRNSAALFLCKSSIQSVRNRVFVHQMRNLRCGFRRSA